MYKIKQLSFFILVSTFSFAASQKFTSEYRFDSSNQPNGIFGTVHSERIIKQTYSVGYDLSGILRYFDFSLGLNMVRPDYSNVTLLDINGNPTKLEPTSELEVSSDISLKFQQNERRAVIDFFAGLNSSPYRMLGGIFKYEQYFFSKATAVGGKISLYRQNQPLSYYIGNDLSTRYRPQTVPVHMLSGYINQVLTERLRVFLEASTSKRHNERPTNVGIELKSSYAITDRLFARLGFAGYRELRREPLLNERGYFHSIGGNAEFTAEPVYDLLCSFSYGITVEREENPATGERIQVGTDFFGIGISYDFGDIAMNFKGSYFITNSRTEGGSLSGGVTWTL